MQTKKLIYLTTAAAWLLNASVACGIVCYEIARQRAGLKAR